MRGSQSNYGQWTLCIAAAFDFLTFAGMRNYGCSPLLVPLASDGEGGVEGVVLSLESLPKGFTLMSAIQMY